MLRAATAVSGQKREGMTSVITPLRLSLITIRWPGASTPNVALSPTRRRVMLDKLPSLRPKPLELFLRA